MKRVNRITSIRIFVSSLETLEQDSFNERGGREGKKATPSLAKRKNSWKNSNKIRESSFANINLFRNDITHTRARRVRTCICRIAKTESILKAYLNTNARNSSSLRVKIQFVFLKGER